MTPFAPLDDFFWPACCPACERPGSDRLCSTCRLVLPRDRGSLDLEGVDQLRSLFLYLGLPRELLLRWKYAPDPHVGAALADLVRDEAPDPAALAWPDCVVPVPTDSRRAKRRGFDQAVILAAAVARSSGLPLRKLLSRRRGSAAQTGLDREARARNLRGFFRAHQAFGRAILLVDDVVTTGATLERAAAVLRGAGARRVSVLTLCRTP